MDEWPALALVEVEWQLCPPSGRMDAFTGREKPVGWPVTPPESRGARQVSPSCSRNRVFLPVNQLSDGRGHEASDRDGTWSSFFFKASIESSEESEPR